MKIDTHQHFWHYRPQDLPWIGEHMPALRQDRLPADNQQAMQACGVDAVIAVQAGSRPEETDFLLQLAAQDARIVGVVGWADLLAPGLAQQLDKWSAYAALLGLRHILQDEPAIATLVGDAAFNRGVSLLQQRQLVYDVLVFGHQLPAVLDFCAQHDAHWLVLDHVGKPAVRDWADAEVRQRWAESIQELAVMPHVVCKLSGLVTETDWPRYRSLQTNDIDAINACFDQALDAFGPQRLMFGSDWPVCELAAPYAAVHHLAQTWAATRLSQTEQEAFWGGNAVRCYGLPVSASSL